MHTASDSIVFHPADILKSCCQRAVLGSARTFGGKRFHRPPQPEYLTVDNPDVSVIVKSSKLLMLDMSVATNG